LQLEEKFANAPFPKNARTRGHGKHTVLLAKSTSPSFRAESWE
jgi:hypothetical protein